MPAEQAKAWTQEVCTDRPSSRTPTQDQVRGIPVTAAAVCRWENPANLGDDTVGLQSATALSSSQITALQGYLTDAVEGQPRCMMIDSPPQVEYYVFLRDPEGRDWRIDVPEPPCLGFDMSGAHYQSEPLVGWLDDVGKMGQPSIDRDDPGEVSSRARALLGDRFVALTVRHDQASYIISVLNLRQGEIDDLTALLQRKVPLYFEKRTVAASDVEELRRTLERAFEQDRHGVRVIGGSDRAGTVLIGVAASRIPVISDVIAAVLPGRQTVSRTGPSSVLVCNADADRTEPCVVVKGVGVGELTN
jgi:hypothetical protein